MIAHFGFHFLISYNVSLTLPDPRLSEGYNGCQSELESESGLGVAKNTSAWNHTTQLELQCEISNYDQAYARFLTRSNSDLYFSPNNEKR